MATTAIAKIDLGEWTLTRRLPAKFLPNVDGPFFGGPEFDAFERDAVEWILENGAMNAATLRYMRSYAGLTGSELATILGQDKAVISRWENGKQAFDVGTWNIVAGLARDALKKRATTKKLLAAIRERRAHQQRGVIELKKAS